MPNQSENKNLLQSILVRKLVPQTHTHTTHTHTHTHTHGKVIGPYSTYTNIHKGRNTESDMRVQEYILGPRGGEGGEVEGGRDRLAKKSCKKNHPKKSRKKNSRLASRATSASLLPLPSITINQNGGRCPPPKPQFLHCSPSPTFTCVCVCVCVCVRVCVLV